MHVAVIDETLVEFDDVGVVDRLKNGELFLQQADVLRDVCSQDRLDSEGYTRVTLEIGKTDSAEMTATNHLDEVVYCAYVCRRESVR